MADDGPRYGQEGGPQFPITTTLEFPDWKIDRSIGMVFGVVVRSMGALKGFTAGFKLSLIHI